MIKRYDEFLFEYNNRNLKFKVFELKRKYPDLVTDKFDEDLNDNFIRFIEDYDYYNHEGEYLKDFKVDFPEFFSTDFINDCYNIGIDIQFMFSRIIEWDNEYAKYFLYDGKNLILCPGGGEDYLSARVAGSGIYKMAHISKDYILKRKEDVPDIEVKICNKYPEYFAQYTLAGKYYKQEKLQTISKYTELDLHNYNNLEHEIHKICKKENISSPDLHYENVGYDKNGILKCFDFISPCIY